MVVGHILVTSVLVVYTESSLCEVMCVEEVLFKL